MKKWQEDILFVVVAVTVAGLFVACGGGGDNSADIASKEADIKISAVKLYKDYKANEVAADEKYKGKILEVTGTIDEISVTLGTIFVSLLVDEYGLETVKGMFSDKYKSKIAELKKGQKITIKGVCDGLTLGIAVSLNNCVIP